MLIVAAGGLPVNIVMYFVLHGGSSHSHGLGHEHGHEHEHEHGHSHGHSHEKKKLCEEICEDSECLQSSITHCHKDVEANHKHHVVK